MQYSTLASEESVKNTSEALLDHGYEPIILENGEEALEKIKSFIPEGVSVMNGSSTTLQQIGFVEYLKEGEHSWNNLHETVLLEKDPIKQNLLRKHAVVSDYYLGSAHAISETGELVIGSNSGSQLPHLAYTSPNIILVISTKKITPTLLDALERLEKHVKPLEDERMKGVYGVGTTLSKILVLRREPKNNGGNIKILLVKEDLGF